MTEVTDAPGVVPDPPRPSPHAPGAAGVAIARGDERYVPVARGGDERGGGLPDPLTPVGVRGVLDGAFDLLRAGFALLVGLAAGLLLPLQLLELASGFGTLEPGSAGGSPLGTLGATGAASSGLDWVLLGARSVVLSFLGLTAGVVVADRFLGRRRTTGSRLVAAGRRWWVALLVPLLCIPPKVVAMLLGGIPFVAVDALLLCASVVAGAEGAGPLRAVGRSWRLGWRSFGTALGISVGGLLITSLLGLVLYLGPLVLTGFLVASESVLLVVEQLTLLTLLVTQPLTACIAARAYVELRCRSEALDIEMRRRSLGLKA